MRLCRLMFLKATGKLIVKISYSDNIGIPSIDEDIEMVVANNRLATADIIAFDVTENETNFNDVYNAVDILLRDGNFIYKDVQEMPIPEETVVNQLNEKMDLLIQMQLEREGII